MRPPQGLRRAGDPSFRARRPSPSARRAARADKGDMQDTSQKMRTSSTAFAWVMVMKARSSEIAEMATIEPTSLIFSPEKSSVPIQDGRSSWPSRLILETKFS